MGTPKKIVIIAGPNGARKTTSYRSLVDSWIVYDTAGSQPTPLASGDNR